MGRPQRPIDPADQSAEAAFARALRQLRADAGDPTYRDLEGRTGFSDTTLSLALSGRIRPSLDVVLALVPVLGGDSVVWEARWRQVYDDVSAVDGQGPGGADPGVEMRAAVGVDLAESPQVGPEAVVGAAAAPSGDSLSQAPQSAPLQPAPVVSISEPGTDVSQPLEATGGGQSRFRRRFGIRGWLIAAAALVLLMGLVAAGGRLGLFRSTDGDSSSLLYARDSARVAMRTCPSTSCEPVELWASGTHVRMVCFRDAEWANYNYRSNRWFNVHEPDSGQSGWVHSSQVSRQDRVGSC